jgi:hypothetical protein
MPNFSKPEFDAAKASGELYINMDRVPLLTINGETVGQSKTIERFLAKKCGFAGSTDMEAAQIDMWCEHLADIKKSYGDSKAGKSGEEANVAKASSSYHSPISPHNHSITLPQSHHITTSPPHHLITSPHHHLTTSQSHHLITSLPHHITTSPPHHLITSPPLHLSTSPPHHILTI